MKLILSYYCNIYKQMPLMLLLAQATLPLRASDSQMVWYHTYYCSTRLHKKLYILNLAHCTLLCMHSYWNLCESTPFLTFLTGTRKQKASGVQRFNMSTLIPHLWCSYYLLEDEDPGTKLLVFVVLWRLTAAARCFRITRKWLSFAELPDLQS